MDTAATLHLFVDEQARRTKALLPLRGIARYQLLADDYGVVAFGGEELPTSVTLYAGKYRLRVTSRLGWATSNTLELELQAGDTAWISLDVDESPRLSRCMTPSGIVETSLLLLTQVPTPLDAARLLASAPQRLVGR